MGGGWYINLGYFWGLICVWSIFPAFIQGTIKATPVRAMAMTHESILTIQYNNTILFGCSVAVFPNATVFHLQMVAIKLLH